MSEQFSTKFNVSTQPFGLQDAEPNPSRDPAEIAYQETLKGTGALPYDMEAKGIEVISWALAALENNPDALRELAELSSSAMLVSAGYHLRDDPAIRGDHRSDLPLLSNRISTEFVTPNSYTDLVFSRLTSNKDRVETLVPLKRERRPIAQKSVTLGRQMGTTAAHLASFPIRQFDPILDKPRDIQLGAKEAVLTARDNIVDIARSSDGVAPSMMQFADHLSRGSLYILRARRDRNVSDTVARAFEASQAFHNV